MAQKLVNKGYIKDLIESLSGLTDTELSAKTDGYVLTYQSSTDKWIASPSGGSGTPAQKEIFTDYTMVSADVSYTIFLSASTGVTITVENTLSDNFECDFINIGTSTFSFTGTTATLNSPDGLQLGPNKVCALLKRLTNNDYWLKGELL